MRLKDTVVTAGGLILQQISSFLVGIFIARSIGASDYGALTIGRNITTILLTIAPIGLDLFLLKHLPSIEGDFSAMRQRFLTWRLIVYFFSFGVVAVCAVIAIPLEESVYKYPGFSLYFIVTVLSLPFSADIAILGAYYRTFGKVGTFSLFTSYFQTIVRSACNLIAIGVGFSTLGVAAGTTLAAFIGAVSISTHLACWSDAKRGARIGASFQVLQLKRAVGVLRESAWMAMNLFVYGLTRSVDVVLLGLFATAKEVGSYGALTLIAAVVGIFPGALSQTLGPTISRLSIEKNWRGVNDALSEYIRRASIIAAFFFGGIAVFGPKLGLLLGKSFVFDPLICVMLPLGYLISATLAPAGYALSMTGKHRQELVVLMAGGGVLVGLIVVFGARFGALGVAGAVVLAYASINVVRFYLVYRHIGYVPGSLWDVTPPIWAILAAQLSEVTIEHFVENDYISTVVACMVYFILYGVVMVSFHFNGTERRTIMGHLPFGGRSRC